MDGSSLRGCTGVSGEGFPEEGREAEDKEETHLRGRGFHCRALGGQVQTQAATSSFSFHPYVMGSQRWFLIRRGNTVEP